MGTNRRIGEKCRPGGGGCRPVVHAANGHTMSGSPHRVLTTATRTVCMLVVMLAMLRTVDARCPAKLHQCSCEWNKDQRFVVNCRYKSLTEVPIWSNATIDIYELTLANNLIQSLNANAFSGLKIKRLDLSDNQIITIHELAFAGLEGSLEELVLHVNAMDQFPKEALAGMVNLHELLVDGFKLPTLTPGALQTLVKLHTLKLEGCELEQVVETDFSGSKDTLVWLSLRDNKLVNVHQNVISPLKNLEVLDLAHNKFAIMSDNLFSGNDKISMLDFSNNQLQKVRPRAYRGLEASLTVLILQNNKLTENQLQPLNVLAGIKELNLATNQIGAIHVESFANAKTIEKINLRANKLTALRRAPFEPILDSLKELELANNNITYIEQGFFSSFKALAILDLSDQILHQVIHSDTFAGLEGTLQRLSMKNAKLVSSDLMTVSNLTSLQSLDVEVNLIEQIPDWTFSRLSQLTMLDLSYNSIANVSQQSMVGMQASLTTINLNSNKLTGIPECTFKGFSALARIKLDLNPLECGCEMVWLRQWIDINFPGLQKYLLNWQCASPLALNNTKLYAVSESQLCPRGYTPAQCKEIVLTTSPSPTTLGSTTSAGIPGSLTPTLTPPQDTVKVSNISHSTALVRWPTRGNTTTGYSVEVRERINLNLLVEMVLPSDAKQYWLRKLEPKTDYTVCITYMYSNTKLDRRWCKDFATAIGPAAVTGGSSNMGAIIGAVVGVLVFFALLVLLAILIVRSRSSGNPLFTKPKWLGGGSTMNNVKSHTPTGIPQAGNNSRRFSRPRPACTVSTTSSQLQLQQNSANSDLEMKLAGFSAEERDRIINMLTTTGGSTVSMISSGSSQRYVPELPPRPQSLEGYLNPQKVRDEEDNPDMHVYDEIPGANANEYEIPISSKHQQNPQWRKSLTESVHSGKYENPQAHSGNQDGACYI